MHLSEQLCYSDSSLGSSIPVSTLHFELEYPCPQDRTPVPESE